MVLGVKNMTANAGDMREAGSVPGLEDPLEEGVSTHSSILAWRIPWTEELGTSFDSELQELFVHFGD